MLFSSSSSAIFARLPLPPCSSHLNLPPHALLHHHLLHLFRTSFISARALLVYHLHHLCSCSYSSITSSKLPHPPHLSPLHFPASPSLLQALYVSDHLHAGTVFVNTYNKTDAAAPFGGFKQSGFGKDLGKTTVVMTGDIVYFDIASPQL